MARDDFIEFVLTTDATSAELAGLTFGDSNNTTSQLVSVFQFDLTTLNSVLSATGRTNFLAGTLIVVKGAGLGGQNLTYNPLAGNISNSDAWSIELVAGQGAKDHPTTVVNGTLNLAVSGDVVWVSTDNPPVNSLDTSSFISAIGHDNAPGAIANAVTTKFGAGSILNTTFVTARSVQNTGGSAVSLIASTTASMGAANSVANQTWIETSLRATAVPEPSRVMLSLIAIGMGIVRRRRLD